MSRRAAFLDRDGVLIHTNVINGKAYAIRTLDELRLLPGVSDAVQKLKNHGYMIIVVTNQPDIDNGLVAVDTVNAIHQKLRDTLPIEAIYMCPHDKRRKCNCRKPNPGLLLQAAADFDLDLTDSWMVGDRASDISAGTVIGCRTVFIDCGYDEAPPKDQDATTHSLPEAVEFIINEGL